MADEKALRRMLLDRQFTGPEGQIRKIPAPKARKPTKLHICPECTSDLVYPVAWEEVVSSRWEVTLRCPNCEHPTTGIFDEESIEPFDEELDRGTKALVSNLRQLTRANMEDDVERFIAALNAEYVLPMDF